MPMGIHPPLVYFQQSTIWNPATHNAIGSFAAHGLDALVLQADEFFPNEGPNSVIPLIKALSDKKEHLVFLLWGKYAQEKGAVIDRTKHLVLTAPHPSPYSVASGFFGCRHFSKTNEYLKQHGQEPIRWVE